MMTNNVIGSPTLFKSLVTLREAEQWMKEEQAKGSGDFLKAIRNNKEVYRHIMDQAVGRRPFSEE